MQNWKIKKMSYQELIDLRKAVRSLLYWYRRGKDYPGTCKLCRIARTYHPKTRGTACHNCLWHIIEGESCAEFALKKLSSRLYLRSLTSTPAWHKLRIPMLRRWAKIVQAEMDCRTCEEA